MDITFLGSTKEVGRSCIGVENEGLSLFLDCGVSANQGAPKLPLQNVKIPHAIALSHAHLDHSGYLPAIYKHSNPPIITTFPTIPLVNMLIEDMEKLLFERRIPPFFNSLDFKRMDRSFLGLPYEMDYQFFNGNNLKLYDAGHILGSSQIFLKTKKANLLFSGDMNSIKTEMHSPAKIPNEKVDILIMESTYGNREHPDRKKLTKEFISKLKEAQEKKLGVIIPSFAVGRTQEILQLLHQNNLLEGVVLDGMGIRASETYLEFPSYIRNFSAFKEALNEVNRAYDSVARKRFARPGKTIICTAGMLEGGPVLSYIQRFMRSEVPIKLFLTGYQGSGTNGRLLLEKRMVRIDGKPRQFKGELESFDFSAHSGRTELLEYAKQINPGKIFLVHGDLEEMVPFSETLRQQGFNVTMPELGEKFEI
jgi:putative mRNA 3-end processing factor